MTLNERGEFTVQDVEGDVRVTVEGVRKHETVSDKWISDDNTHWHECTCGGKIDEAASAARPCPCARRWRLHRRAPAARCPFLQSVRARAE